MIDVSIVIVTWKMKEVLHDLLASLKEHVKGVTYEVIVADNASHDGTVEMIRSEFPDAVLIENDRNRGVSGARNQGFARARGRYIQILDADMVLRENSIRKLIEFADAQLDAGVTACKLTFPDGTLQPSCRHYPTPMSFLMRRLAGCRFAQESRALRHHEMADWDHGETRDVDYVIGACQLIRREALEQVGALDEKIFYGPEDIDFCLRMYRKGWRVYYYPYTAIIHYEQRMTKKKVFTRITFLHLRGLAYLYWKYGGRLSRARTGNHS